MKLIYAGEGMAAKSYTELLFNCTRNQKCQKPFYVPIQQFSDLSFFADLAGEPELIEIEVLNVCDIDNIGAAVSNTYVAGTTPEGSWYGVFSDLIVTPPMGVTYNKFFFRFSITISGSVHVFYSEQFEFPICETLKLIKGCYPNEAVGANAFDCNGIYYGFPNNPEEALGTVNFRYFHKAFLRMASVIEQSNKMTFTAFNSKKTYKSVFNREHLLEFELVPTFYKDTLIGIFNRGNIEFDGSKWRLSDEQSFSITDRDSKLWILDVLLAEECKQTFGCGEDDCVLPPVHCILPEFEFSQEVIEGVAYGTLTGTLGVGQVLYWEVYEKYTMELIDSGDSSSEPSPDPYTFEMTDVDPETGCYLIRWRVACSEDNFSDWSETVQFGNCETPPTYHSYVCERYLCSNCSEPLDSIIAQSTNPALILFKYYKSLASPTTITLRPIATSVDGAIDTIIGFARDSCVLSCGDPPPIDPED